jgi:hypothetical protein
MTVCPSSSEMSRSIDKFKLLTAIIILALCGFIGVAVALKLAPMSDGRLASRFAKQSNEIERLVSIVREAPTISIVQRHSESNSLLLVVDNAGRVIPASVLGQPSLELHRLFGVVDCDYVSRNASEFTLAFRRNGIEDLYPGGIKVIAFRSTPPTSIVSSIDDFRRNNRGNYDFYQHLGGCWYVKYEQVY